jgi:hypothetical protein
MSRSAKILAVIVLIGGMFGVLNAARIVVRLAANGALGVAVGGPGGAMFVLQTGLGFVFSVCALMLSIMVLADKRKTGAPKA